MKVQTHLYLAVFIAIYFLKVVRPDNPWGRTHLIAVSSFDGIEDLYLHVRLQKPQSALQEKVYGKTSKEVKKAICRNIFNHHTRQDEEFWFNTDLSHAYNELREDYHPIFQRIYRRPASTMCYAFACTSESDYRYSNPYELKIINVKGTAVQERVFTCLVRKHYDDRIIKQYFVSEEYNVNVKENQNFRNEEYIVGRFVFGTNIRNELVPRELAEEGAIVTRPSVDLRNIEVFYLSKRKDHRLADEENDPICTLSAGYKARLCASVMNALIMIGTHNSHQFEEKFKFRSDTITSDYHCTKREIVFHSHEVKSEISDKVYQEWTISCSATVRGSTVESVYYVSRGYGQNTIFAYEPSEDEDKMVLDHHSYNVSVVEDAVSSPRRRSNAK